MIMLSMIFIGLFLISLSLDRIVLRDVNSYWGFESQAKYLNYIDKASGTVLDSGALIAIDGKVYLPNHRNIFSCLDARTGELLGDGNKDEAAKGDYWNFNATPAFHDDRAIFTSRGWGGLEPFDIPLPHVLARAGIHSHIETDHYHYFQGGGEFYATSFSTWGAYRGQEYDPMPGKIRPGDDLDPTLTWNRAAMERNRQRFVTDLDFPSPRTLKSAAEWLKLNEDSDNYLLWVEAFDPHSPMDYPAEYDRVYSEELKDDFPIAALPVGLPQEKIDRFYEDRRKYANLLAMTDKWLGELLDEIERQKGWHDTLIIFTTDHGLLFGEHGHLGKNAYHAWNELAHIPLFVHLPGDLKAGERRSQLTQSIDLFPTLVEYFNAPAEQFQRLGLR